MKCEMDEMILHIRITLLVVGSTTVKLPVKLMSCVALGETVKSEEIISAYI